MARRARKKASATPAAVSDIKPKGIFDNGESSFEKQQVKERLLAFNDLEVERRIAAIQAIRDAEIASLLSKLRLLRSYFTKEQHQMPAFKFFQENCPNLSVIKNEKYKVYELEWKDNTSVLQGNYIGGHIRDSLIVNANRSTADSFQFSAKSVKSCFLDAINLQKLDFVDGPSDVNSTGVLQTPGVTANDRLSFGMTPKTMRLPKKGEMLLSVRGSPLGVYEEENLEVIRESEDGSLGKEV